MFDAVRTVKALALLALLPMAAIYGMVRYTSGSGKLWVVGVEGRVIIVDGQRFDVEPGVAVSWDLERGRHHVVVEDAQGAKVTEQMVSIESGFTELVRSLDATQCFVRLDVTRSHYGSPSTAPRAAEMPQVVDRYRGGLFSLPWETTFEAYLPEKRPGRARQYMPVSYSFHP